MKSKITILVLIIAGGLLTFLVRNSRTNENVAAVYTPHTTPSKERPTVSSRPEYQTLFPFASVTAIPKSLLNDTVATSITNIIALKERVRMYAVAPAPTNAFSFPNDKTFGSDEDIEAFDKAQEVTRTNLEIWAKKNTETAAERKTAEISLREAEMKFKEEHGPEVWRDYLSWQKAERFADILLPVGYSDESLARNSEILAGMWANGFKFDEAYEKLRQELGNTALTDPHIFRDLRAELNGESRFSDPRSIAKTNRDR